MEELLSARGVMVSYEAVRLWCTKFGPAFAAELRRVRKPVGRQWFLDEIFVRIGGVQQYLWRAVDQHGVVVDLLVQSRRDRATAERFFRHLLRSSGVVPHTITTDRLASDKAALPRVLPQVRHRRGHWLNNRAECSHQPTRERERHMRRFKSAEQAQRFVSVHNVVTSHFRPRRHRLSADRYRAVRQQRFRAWNGVTQTNSLALVA